MNKVNQRPQNVMRKRVKKKRPLMSLFLSVCVSHLLVQAVIAEDTEIFVTTLNNKKSVNPNVMLVVDTSGSMSWNVDANEVQTDFPNVKMTIVKEVISDLLLELNGTNLGLSRFGSEGPGAAVLAPIKDLDSEAEPLIFRELKTFNDDGYEILSNGQVVLDSDVQPVGEDGRIVALRFTDVNVPQGARVTRATLSLTSRENQFEDQEYTIWAEKSPSAAPLTSVPGNISSRTRTTASVDSTLLRWRADFTSTFGGLNPVIQEVVDQSGWCGGQDMLFLIETDADDKLQNFVTSDGIFEADGKGTQRELFFPQLIIEYDKDLPSSANGCFYRQTRTKIAEDHEDFELAANTTPGELDFFSQGANNAQRFGLSFPAVKVPRGAKIIDAYVSFRASQASTSSSVSTISVVNSSVPVDDLSAFSSPQIVGPSWAIPPVDVEGDLNSPSVVNLVQGIVNRADWDEDNNMLFVFTGTSGDHKAYSFEGAKSKAPRLTIKYQEKYRRGKYTHRDWIKNRLGNLLARGSTPIADTLSEMARYFKGDDIFYGKGRSSVQTNRLPHASSYTGGTRSVISRCLAGDLNDLWCKDEKINGAARYIQPKQEECQSNHLVLLTDGTANGLSSETQTFYNNWTGGTCSDQDDCSIKMAGYMNGIDIDSSLDEVQNVITHTVGFGAGADPVLMAEIATAGNGITSNAKNKNELVATLSEIADAIDTSTLSFVTSGVSVDQANRLTHKNELYYALFSPASQGVWPGNLKRFRLQGGRIYDQKGALAINPVTAEFFEFTQSFWSATPDGFSVAKGGAASKLTTSRNIFSNLASNNLFSLANRFNRGNVTPGLIGLPSAPASAVARDKVVDWVLGYDIADAGYSTANPSGAPASKWMSDPLHSTPVIIDYAGGESRAFLGTNDGFLHAFNTAENSGEEVWAFIPKEMLSKLPSVVANTSSNHQYGLDGDITFYLDDANNNNIVDPGEMALLYVGMRRGGRSYYVIDISNPNAPNLKFVISGESGVGTGPNPGAYAKLGQTWSKPVIGKMNLPGGNNDNLVMIFGGGYDVDQDLAANVSATDNIGNIVYIADALNGKLLWTSLDTVSPGQSEGAVSLLNSVPADVTAIDLDGDADGFIDHFYVSDTKAQIFRFDVSNSGSANSITGGRVASLQPASVTLNSNRRFYYPVDAALISTRQNRFVSLSLGSGYRAHPLNTDTSDRFYMIKDMGVFTNEFDMDRKESDLTDITDLVGSSRADGRTDAGVQIETDGGFGWYLNFSKLGEKVIQRSITFNNVVLFTTYIPPSISPTATVCSNGESGNGRVYGLSIIDGNPFRNTNFDGDLTKKDRYINLVSPGIAPPPQVILEGTDQGVMPRLCVGKECNINMLPTTRKGIIGYKWRKEG